MNEFGMTFHELLPIVPALFALGIVVRRRRCVDGTSLRAAW